LSKTMRVWGNALHIPDALRRKEAQSVTLPPPPTTTGFTHRADAGSAAAASDILTRFAVVLLSGINAVMWEVYTESRFMAAIWAAIAIGVAIWIKRDAGRR
jgi:hypothetical protein